MESVDILSACAGEVGLSSAATLYQLGGLANHMSSLSITLSRGLLS